MPHCLGDVAVGRLYHRMNVRLHQDVHAPLDVELFSGGVHQLEKPISILVVDKHQAVLVCASHGVMDRARVSRSWWSGHAASRYNIGTRSRSSNSGAFCANRDGDIATS